MGNSKKKAILIDIIPLEITKQQAQLRLQELESLMATFGGISLEKIIQKRRLPDYSTYIGKGKLQEVKQLAIQHQAGLIIVNNILKPRQIFNINQELEKDDIKAWDRVDLILKIFSKHAQSTEAKLQIELAGIRHMGPRIYDMGIELSQQKGGTSTRGGQGETNTEMMKRHLRKQELNILKKLEHYSKIRQGHRKRRRRFGLKTAALVGYTNAGKSSLLNALTQKGAYAADALFATLDTRVGKLFLPSQQQENNYTPPSEILISDTIGFIQDLPPKLIQAFKSTLSETVDADIILHVIDIADPEMHMKITVVEDILSQLQLNHKPKIYIFNKLDLIADSQVFSSQNKPSTSLLQAGEDTSQILGWSNPTRNDLAHQKIIQLKQHYSQHQPLFLSAHKKFNLSPLISALRSISKG